MTVNRRDANQIPQSFPRPFSGSLSGAHPKISARLIDGQVVAGMTEEELYAKYEACRDLAMQLIEYAKRKRDVLAETPLKDFLQRLRKGVANKGWDFEPRELDWVMLQVAVGMGGGPADVRSQNEVQVTLAVTCSPAPSPVPTVVDYARARTGVPAEPE